MKKLTFLLSIALATVTLMAQNKKPDLTGIYGPDVKTIGIPAFSP